MSEKFYDGDMLLAEITDSELIIYKGSHETQNLQYRLDSLTEARPVYSHESDSHHVVVFGTQEPPGQTVGVVWSGKDRAFAFRDAVTNAVVN